MDYDSLVVEYVHDDIMHVQKISWTCQSIMGYDSLVVDEHHNQIIKILHPSQPIYKPWLLLPRTMMYYPMNVRWPI
jgi:hypothetical protein